ncbi:MAG: FMN-binding negative transcriptional regulator [Proteobacteria bacterium]|nr:FMN-binding negative transcriptional regulator [Pseudomonadota bacterium]
MYIPDSFAVRDLGRVHEFIRHHGFATLVSSSDQGPVASHVPLWLDASAGEQGVLHGHVARANPHWQLFNGEDRSLAVFHGPHAYVSPTWYAARHAVPTWNYAVVHATGRPRRVDEPELRAALERLVEQYEGPRDDPWPGELPEAMRRGLLDAIVGFELPIERLEAKFKLSQNRSGADARGVVEKLEASDREDDRGVAALMRALRES